MCLCVCVFVLLGTRNGIEILLNLKILFSGFYQNVISKYQIHMYIWVNQIECPLCYYFYLIYIFYTLPWTYLFFKFSIYFLICFFLICTKSDSVGHVTWISNEFAWFYHFYCAIKNSLVSSVIRTCYCQLYSNCTEVYQLIHITEISWRYYMLCIYYYLNIII
jgi:hypothetical protein